MEEDKNAYVDSFFSEEYEDLLFGKAKVTCYVFKPKLEGRDVKKTKGIMLVHSFGYPANMDEIMRIAKKYNLADLINEINK